MNNNVTNTGYRNGRNDWRPTAELAALRLRAGILTRIRSFFADRGVLEVETPLLGATSAAEPHLASMRVVPWIENEGTGNKETGNEGPGGRSSGRSSGQSGGFLQTSPESFMKRLLAAGSCPIFQMGKAFRAGEEGRFHNPEFTLLEWYRPGFGTGALMDEVDGLAASILGTGPGARLAYGEAFRRHADLDPFHAPLAALRARAGTLGVVSGEAGGLDRDACLDLILSLVVQPALGPGPVFLEGFPSSQAAMARLVPDGAGNTVAERFELFVHGVELANGYRELSDPREQRARFVADGEKRRQAGLPAMPMDERLLAALAHGLPDASGVALGVDRLVMLAAGETSLDGVLAFPFRRA